MTKKAISRIVAITTAGLLSASCQPAIDYKTTISPSSSHESELENKTEQTSFYEESNANADLKVRLETNSKEDLEDMIKRLKDYKLAEYRYADTEIRLLMDLVEEWKLGQEDSPYLERAEKRRQTSKLRYDNAKAYFNSMVKRLYDNDAGNPVRLLDNEGYMRPSIDIRNDFEKLGYAYITIDTCSGMEQLANKIGEPGGLSIKCGEENSFEFDELEALSFGKITGRGKINVETGELVMDEWITESSNFENNSKDSKVIREYIMYNEIIPLYDLGALKKMRIIESTDGKIYNIIR